MVRKETHHSFCQLELFNESCFQSANRSDTKFFKRYVHLCSPGYTIFTYDCVAKQQIYLDEELHPEEIFTSNASRALRFPVSNYVTRVRHVTISRERS